jgi:hypothetical protein
MTSFRIKNTASGVIIGRVLGETQADVEAYLAERYPEHTLEVVK